VLVERKGHKELKVYREILDLQEVLDPLAQQVLLA
jgi:hypothetical protein